MSCHSRLVVSDALRTTRCLCRPGADFSALMFQEFDFECPEMQDERIGTISQGTPCRYLFGFRLDVLNYPGHPSRRVWTPLYDKGAQPALRNASGKGWFAFVHGVTPAINAQVVSYPFKRDTCSATRVHRAPSSEDGFHGLVRHKRAVVTVQCGACIALSTTGTDDERFQQHLVRSRNLADRLVGPRVPAYATDGELKRILQQESVAQVCSAQRSADGCDLELHLAMPQCPTPTLRILEALHVEVRTRDGRQYDAVRAGSPHPRFQPGGRSNVGGFPPVTGGVAGAFTATTHVVVWAALPVLLGRPRLRGGSYDGLAMQAVGVLESLIVRGSLAEGADDANIGSARPGMFRVEAQCTAPSDARVDISMIVERGTWEPLSFAIQPCL